MQKKLLAALEAAGGWLPFDAFMHLALYAPGLGYYAAGQQKLGLGPQDGSDFVTAPELSPFFGVTVARQVAEILQATQTDTVWEFGAGSGALAAQVIPALQAAGVALKQYYIVDVSANLRARQQERLAEFADLVQWVHALPEQMQGVILGNEVLDAMPVDDFTMVNNERVIRHVATADDNFAWVNVDGFYTSEFNPALPAWLQSMADSLAAGALLLIDYGYEENDYYRPERSSGTLICHYQHRVHDNPLIYVGLQDITASVDFTAVANAGLDAGLMLAGYTTQAAFLANSGLEALFIAALQARPENQYKLAQQVRTLSLPSEMGERFKVIALCKGFTSELQGFTLGDQRHRL